MALSNTAVPKYYGEFRDAVIRGEIPVCKEIEMEMNRIDDLIADPDVYYDDQAVEGFIKYCENELTLTDGSDLKLLDSFKVWAEQIFGWYEMCIRDSYDTEFIKYIDREMTAYIDKCEKRMLSGFSILKKHIADYKGRWLEKIDKSQYEKDVCELIDSLNNGEESAMRKTLRKTLRAVSEVKEFYISQSGDVYLKKI